MDMVAWKEYYSNDENLAKISYQTRWREVVIIKQLEDRKVAIRPFKCFSTFHLKFLIERLSLKTTLFDLYQSNASFRLPKLPFDMKKLKEYREYLNTNWQSLITGWDFFIDIDASSEDDEPLCIDWAKQIRGEMKKKEYGKSMMPIEIWKTGSGGVHLILNGQFNPDFVKENVQDICCELGIPMNVPIKDIDGIRHIARDHQWIPMKKGEEIPEVITFCDTSIYDWRRIRRVGFSLHSKTGKPMVRFNEDA
jgi:hypothetical protein